MYLIRLFTTVVKHALGLHHQGRKLPVQPDDTLIASYPDSGDTWLCFLAANLIHTDRTVDFSNLNKLIVDPSLTIRRDVDRAPRPRIVTSHASFDSRYQRVIYLVRDPRDVALAQYRRLQTLGNEFALADFTGRFLNGDLNRDRGSWGENVGSWLAGRSRYSGFLLVRYEDLISDTTRELSRVAHFAGWPATPSRISQAIERSAGKLQKSPKRRVEISMLNPPSKLSEWRRDLPNAQIVRIESAWGDIMACLGYECVTRDPKPMLNSTLIGLLAAGTARQFNA